MKDDLIQYLIDRAGELVDAVSGSAEGSDTTSLHEEAEELTALAGRLLARREAAAVTYREAA